MLEIEGISLSAGINNTSGTVTISNGDISIDSYHTIGSGMNHFSGVTNSGTITVSGSDLSFYTGGTNTILFAFSQQEDFSISDVEDDDNQTIKKTPSKTPSISF